MVWTRRGERKGAKRLPERLRQEVIARDRARGRGCFFDFDGICLGINQPDIQVHHIIDAEDGGSDAKGNLITACTPCHTHHSARVSGRRAWDWRRKPERHPSVSD